MLFVHKFFTVNKTPYIAQPPYNPGLFPADLFLFLKYKVTLKA